MCSRVFICFACLCGLLSLLSCSAAMVSRFAAPEIIAHRGGISSAPENSLAAIERSVLSGVDAVEVDVRMSADGVPVLMHDASVNRTTDGWGRVDRLCFDELRCLSLLDSVGNATCERVPSLREALELVDGRCDVLIEVKDKSGRGVEEAVAAAVELCGAEEWVAVQSFSDRILERFSSLGVAFPLEKLFVFKLPLLPVVFDGGFSYFSMKKYCYVSSFNINHCFARPGLVKKIRSSGKEVKLWTFDAVPERLPLPVDGVIVDAIP